MSDPFVGIAAFLGVAALAGAGMLVAARLLQVRPQPSSLKTRTYESGEEPYGVAWVRFHPRYYVVALFFVLFDVEAAYLLPWAAALRQLGVAAAGGMALFVSVLTLGWLYALRKGALRWQ